MFHTRDHKIVMARSRCLEGHAASQRVEEVRGHGPSVRVEEEAWTRPCGARRVG